MKVVWEKMKAVHWQHTRQTTWVKSPPPFTTPNEQGVATRLLTTFISVYINTYLTSKELSYLVEWYRTPFFSNLEKVCTFPVNDSAAACSSVDCTTLYNIIKSVFSLTRTF